MEIRQWWWYKTHYEEKMDVKLTDNNNGTFTSEPLDIALKPGDQVCIRTFLPIENNSMSEFIIVYEKRWYTKLKRVLRTIRR